MQIPRDPRELAETLLARSVCSVQVAAVIADLCGVHAWGWNSSGADGLGLHAEAHAISRGNRRRFPGSTIYVASRRRRNGKTILSKPCEECAALVRKHGLRVMYRDADGVWI